MTAEGSFCEAVQGSLLLGEDLSEEQRRHAEECAACRSAVQLSRGLHGTLGAGPKWTKGDRVLEQYDVLEELGRGGQGAVYKARDLETGLVVALKAVALDRESVEEVRLAVGITHPNVCRINHTRSAGPFRIIVMEYVRGGSLRERLARGPIPVVDALRIFRGICEGVRAAHERDVIHGDLKPGNVLLRDGLEPVVCDFGLATTSGAAPRGGTDGYEAPEHARRDLLGPRTDVYALGVILRELVPKPSRAIADVISGACAEDPEQRTPTVSALLAGLDRGPRRRSSLALAGAAVVTAVAVALGLAWGRRQVDPTSAVVSATTPPTAAVAARAELDAATASSSSLRVPDASSAQDAPGPTDSAQRPAQATPPAKRPALAARSAAPSAAAPVPAPAPPTPGAVHNQPCCDALRELAKQHPKPNVLNVSSAMCNFAKMAYREDMRWMVENNLSCRGIPPPCEPVPVPPACK